MHLFDASALLAYLLDEPGADTVEEALDEPSACSAANWAEVAQKVQAHGRDWRAARTLLLGSDLVIAPVVLEDAELAARLWSTDRHLSLGDRLCLATGERLDATIWTCDAAWGEGGRIRQLR